MTSALTRASAIGRAASHAGPAARRHPQKRVTYGSGLKDRTFSSSDRPKITLFITGGKAMMGPAFALEAMRRGHQVVSLSRQVPTQVVWHSAESSHSSYGSSFLQWVNIQGQEIKDEAFWRKLYSKYAHNSDEIHVVNTLGISVAPPGSTLADINVRPVTAALTALEERVSRTGQRGSVGSVSSVCATFFPTDQAQRAAFCEQSSEYCTGRQELDRTIDRSVVPSVIVRPGYVFTDAREDRIIDTGHPYSPEQFATLPIHPIIGSGGQIQQPVYIGDVVDAVMNGLEDNESHMVDAVGPEAMTQREMFKFFTDLTGRKFRPIEVPFEIAFYMAKHFPKGRVAPYAIAMFRHLDLEEHKKPLCPQKFEALVRKPLTSMAQKYAGLDKTKLKLETPPIREHAGEILQVMMRSPEARKDMALMARKYGLEVCKRAAFALLS